MSRRGLLSACVALLAGIPEARGQPAAEAPPRSGAPPVIAAPPDAAPVQGSSQPDPSVLFPTIRPAEASPPGAGPGGFPTCDARCETFWTRPTLTGDWWGLRPRLQEQGIRFGGNVTQFAFGLGGGINGMDLPNATFFRSSPVKTARTFGLARAAAVSIETMVACARSDRRKNAWT